MTAVSPTRPQHAPAPAPLAPAVYRGTVRHERKRADAPALFTHPLSFVYADLDELPHALGGRLTRLRPGLMRIRPRDLHGRRRDFAATCAAVRATVAERSGRPAPTGRIGVLTHPRTLGVSFNPVSFYYLHDEAGALDAVLAEVTSTPWHERRAYVLRAASPGAQIVGAPAEPVGAIPTDPPAHSTGTGGLSGEHLKEMRVSPFQPMDQRYEWTVSAPGERLTVAIVNRSTSDGRTEHAAALQLEREPLTRGSLRAMVRRHPAGTLRILALIYGHAVALKARGASLHPRHTLTGGGA